MSKKDKQSKANNMHSNNKNMENQNNNAHKNDFDHECHKENCTCTKQNDSSSLTEGE